MLTCKDASQLMSQSIDRPLSFMEKAGLKFHLLICKSCHMVNKQMEFIHRLCRQIAESPDDISSMQAGLSTEAQKRILKELHRKQDE